MNEETKKLLNEYRTLAAKLGRVVIRLEKMSKADRVALETKVIGLESELRAKGVSGDEINRF